MSFGVAYNVLDQKGSPAIYSSTLSTRPSAGFAGRIFISTDTFEIYRDNGLTWDLIGTGSSGTLQTVTNAGNTTTNNIVISKNGGLSVVGGFAGSFTATYAPNSNQGSNDFYGLAGQYSLNLTNAAFSGADTFNRSGLYGATFINGNNGNKSTARFASITGAATFTNVNLEDYALLYAKAPDVSGVNVIDNLCGLFIDDLDSSSVQIFYGVYQKGTQGYNFFEGTRFEAAGLLFLNFQYTSGVDRYAKLGDYQYSSNGTHLFIDDVNNNISMWWNGQKRGLDLDYNSNTYTLGYTVNNGINISVYANEIVTQQSSGSRFGFYMDNGTQVLLGDFDGIINSTWFGVDDNLQTLIASANLLSGTSGGSSGQHLIINVGGNPYKIALLNP